MTKSRVNRPTSRSAVRGESLAKIEVTDFGYSAYPYPYGQPVLAGLITVATAATEAIRPTATPSACRTTNERKLIVEIFDNASRQEAWVGWMESTSSSKVDTEKVLAGVRLILGGFPPGAEAR